MALRRITLSDFVIVRALELELQPGFTVLTGETGAGKSILIDALQLLLGARADAGVVREGAQRTDISAEFDPDSAGSAQVVADWLEEAGIEAQDTLLLRRTVDVQGRSRAWINGTPVTATQMRALGVYLLDIHGQHAWQSLTRPDAVRALLDAYAGVQTDGLQPLWSNWREAGRALERARQAQDTLAQERERLQWQIGEVDKLQPAEGEWEELNARHARLSNAQALIDSAQGALALLQGCEESGDMASAALSALAQAQELLQGYEDVDEAFRLLDRVGLAHMADKRADELSGGQRQRVGICRALIQDPALLLVDEPTASLDPKTSRQIMRLICELCKERGLAAIINIHDVALAQMFVQIFRVF